MRSIPFRAGAAGAALIIVAAAHAAPVTWGTPQPITGNSDVSTLGTLLDAINLGGATNPSQVTDTTVNGVTFRATARNFASGTAPLASGSFRINPINSNFASWGAASTGGSGPAFTSLSPEYQNLLSQGWESRVVKPVFGASPLFITVNGLDVGQEYQIQLWTHSSPFNRSARFSDGTNSVVLFGNSNSSDDGMGQFVLGTFVADGTSQTISMLGLDFSNGMINAVQVRIIPTPGAAALLGLSGLIATRRRRV